MSTDNLAEVFDVLPVEVVDKEGNSTIIPPDGTEDEDYTYVRARHYELAEKGSEALRIAMKIADQTETPAAIKELSGLLKNLSDVNTALLNLHKSKAEIKAAKGAKGGQQNVGTNVEQQNIIFAGSSKELNKLIADQMNQTTDK